MYQIHPSRVTNDHATNALGLRSFFLGGFECACHRRKDGTQVDVTAMTQHDRMAEQDYSVLQQAGIRTVRDGLRWHRIEVSAGVYDWSSFLPMLKAATRTGTQVIWDLCHWGVPRGVDVRETKFVDRFAAFAGAAARVIRDESDLVPYYCPINEISFWSWIGGEIGSHYPYCRIGPAELKRQLVRASIAAMQEVWAVEPRSRFLHAEPVIHIASRFEAAAELGKVESYRLAQYEVWDMLAGRLCPELGGKDAFLDIPGLNYYWNNQWAHHGPILSLGHPSHRPFRTLLQEVHDRYRRPFAAG